MAQWAPDMPGKPRFRLTSAISRELRGRREPSSSTRTEDCSGFLKSAAAAGHRAPGRAGDPAPILTVARIAAEYR